jgi:hypothetical protein
LCRQAALPLNCCSVLCPICMCCCRPLTLHETLT